jgi:hypothetical protein
MNIRWMSRYRRSSQIAYSRTIAARLYRVWRRYTDDPARQSDTCIADILLLPLAGLMLIIFLLGIMPGASDAIAEACSVACMP